ncbi:MAG: energy-coupling factor transporter transmembrane component T [Coriobacteriaceae bacterium]|nr:energy-coupling factor transporter transmembrane component T [Coriobacteriaceae bacterium]MDY3800401.1 energy-coupling factor transporter transmembrane component T [Eggerthellaceae bacterium]
MSFNATSYNPRITPVHRIDARVKIVLVVAYSIALFFVQTWSGLGLFAIVLALAVAASRLRLLACIRQLIPLLLILSFTLIANSFSFDVSSAAELYGIGAVSSGVFQEMQPVALIGTFGFVPAGFARGCFYVLRIAFLLCASLVLVTTTSTSELSHAIRRFLVPLERFGLPVHDIATTISIALRFIPVTVDEFNAVRMAQASRGADFEGGGLIGKLKMWGTVLIPMFVGLFRRAERLATAMDARCYGMGKTSYLNQRRMDGKSWVLLISALILFACVSLFF